MMTLKVLKDILVYFQVIKVNETPLKTEKNTPYHIVWIKAQPLQKLKQTP